MRKSKGAVCPRCGGYMHGRPGQTLCAKCAKRERSREYMRSYMPRGDEPRPNRRCHDCGKPTFNYRCEECRERLATDGPDYTGYSLGA